MSDNAVERLWNSCQEFSVKVFGPPSYRGPRGPLNHLKKEVDEVLAEPFDLKEYADCYLLLTDAARRAGFTYQQFFTAIATKLEENWNRTWPDWRKFPGDVALEHKRD